MRHEEILLRLEVLVGAKEPTEPREAEYFQDLCASVKDWIAAAQEITQGWVVRRYNATEGELIGLVTVPAVLDQEVLKVSVGWEHGNRHFQETLSEPLWRRTLRRSDSSVIIGSTDTVLVFHRGVLD